MIRVPNRRVRVFIVEGETDKTALGLLLSRLISSAEVDCDVFGEDIFGHVRLGAGEDPLMREANILKRINTEVSNHIKTADYDWKDVEDIVILTDTDGCFIDDSLVIEQKNIDSKLYCIDHIETPIPEIVRRNNSLRASNIIRAVQRGHLKKGLKTVPLSVYYFSRNLEHALHNEAGYLSKRRKIWLARRFENTYKNRPTDFIAFLENELCCPDGYGESWAHIQKDAHSLERGSNLALLFRAVGPTVSR